MANVAEDVGKIWKAFHSPCLPTPQIWLKTFKPAAIKLFWSVIEPGWKQDIKLLTGKSWLKHLKQVMVDSEVEESAFQEASLGFLFESAEWLDKISWWWFVADSGADFLANWTSLAMKAKSCTREIAAGTFAGTGATGFAIKDGIWHSSAIYTETMPNPGLQMGAEVIVAANASWTLGCCMSLAKGQTGTATITGRLRDTFQDIVVETSSAMSVTELSGGAAIILMGSGTNPLGVETSIVFEILYEGDDGSFLANIEGGEFSAYQGGNELWF